MSRRSSLVLIVVVMSVTAGLTAMHTGGGRLRDWLLALHGLPAGHARRAQRRPPGTPAPAWPQTKAGDLARRWADAFSSGEDAMRRFLEQELAQSSLAQRRIDERLSTYRSWHERFKTFALDSYGASSDVELKATLLAADGSPYAFAFEAQAEAPFKLIAVRLTEVQTHPH